MLHEQHCPFHGVWGPTVLSWPVNPALGNAFTVQHAAGRARPSPGLTCQPSCLPPPDNTRSCSPPAFALALAAVWKARPQQQTPHKIPAWPMPASGVLPPRLPRSLLGRLAVAFQDLKAWGAEDVSASRS